MNGRQIRTMTHSERILIVENDIEQRLRETHIKWKHANTEVADVCRDAAEEIRVLKTQLNSFRAGVFSSQSYQHTPLGWGKGKDE